MQDFSISSDNVVLNRDLDLVLQQIDILFDTTPSEVLGDEDFGSRYDQFLYNLSVTNEGIKNQVISDLAGIDLRGFVPRVEVYLMQGTEQDIALIKIELTRDSSSYQRIYKIS